ncbi:(p)ppGpp synthetase I, SpoT/RelA [Pseudidiomarina planktonica]|uniref:GTP pyrophosphokinase n=1 Tax=Pseudidiomarina planktonica TaxID=1323738 RepID=A0A1Y6EQ16_9GAMM|nr:GTP diphosphokinase [Pseudidiomarina planktonica]RUO65516.1 GTP diphosphokinase [Pseudidiomarina planktonica]SMQ64667.1 (p)ppGpp synthetase I, SpoT/RelA [Pseudidiomarina planktonica]
MVHIRSTHVDNPSVEQGDWLASLQSETKTEALTAHAKRLQQLCKNDPQLLLKGQEMVEILVSLNLDTDSLVAALYTPAADAGLVSDEQASQWGGPDLPILLQAVRQMQTISSLQHFRHGTPDSGQIDNVRRMLLSMVADVRAVLIKLAERICFLREVKDADEESRVLAAKECQDIYAPLANRLGIGQLKWELEDLSFRYLHPITYKDIAKKLHERRVDRENYIDTFVSNLQQALQAQDIHAEVYGRPKHIYSIWRKMQKKHLHFDQLFDIRAVRIVTRSLKDCYGALGVVHTRWRHIGSEFDDYVATPKANGYQSIHTVVVGPEDKHVEIQIRSSDMHEDAELGVAAHWLYKEGAVSGRGQGFEEKIAWLRKLLAWHDDMAENDDLVAEIRSQVFEDRVYVFTPKGEVIDMPAGSTPLDFAYYIHSQIGHRCVGAKVDGRIVPFTYHLQNGDRIEILTQKSAQPRRDWLNPQLGYLQTARARAKVQTYFKKLDRDKNIATGKDLLEHELQKYSLTLQHAEKALSKFNVQHLDDLLAGIGAGDVRLHQVVNQLKPDTDTTAERLERLTQRRPQKARKPSSDVTVEGIGNLLMQFAKCCQPLPGEDIMGFVTLGRGVSVHRRDCEQLQHLLQQHPERAIDVSWSRRKQTGQYRADVRISALDRHGLLHDITSVLANEKASVVQLDSFSDEESQLATVSLGVMLQDSDDLQRIMSRLGQLSGVQQVRRSGTH